MSRHAKQRRENLNGSSAVDSGRRELLRQGMAGAAGAALLGYGRVAGAASAETADEIRIGLIGCGARGRTAVRNALDGIAGAKLVAMGDLFKEQLDEGYKALQKAPGDKVADQLAVTPDRMYAGFDSYEKVLATDCNYVILATPPGFRPIHLHAAVNAGKHIFTEKPLAVDGPGIRTCFELVKLAEEKKLAVGVGLQRRHSKGYLETMKRIKAGAIGDIIGGRAFWMQRDLWFKARQPTWTDVEWQIRNWLYFTWLSGDHIVEQHLHNIDVVQWAIGKPPVAAVAVGGRQQRTDIAFGHIYDHFAVDFEYPNDVHVLSMSRQIPGCHNDISEHVTGTKGRADLASTRWAITPHRGGKSWTRDTLPADVDPYVQEHVDLADAIRKGKPYSELQAATESNLTAIMGRMSAYTGKRVTWDQALNSKENLHPSGELKFGKMELAKVAIPGTTDVI
jgi:myo-inositol 2-dehydrogenase/D-chiro-inositol 1-dehydrogenase